MTSELHSSEAGGAEVSRLSQQVRDRAVAERLARRLTNYGLPDVELPSLHATRVALRSHVTGWVALEFFPGDGARTSEEPDRGALALMRAHVEHAEGLRQLASVDARALSLISDPPSTVNFTGTFVDPRGLVFCDPELLIADALTLPTVRVGEVRRYRRLTLLAKDARIDRVIFPPEENIDRHIRRVVSLIQTSSR
jgi:hypothetical protein